MTLTTHCTSCNKDIKIKSWATDRSDLSKEKGDEFTIDCSHCGVTVKTHVNDVSAKPNMMYAIIGVAISAVVTILLWRLLGAIGTITLAIPIMIWQQQAGAAHRFNVYRTSR